MSILARPPLDAPVSYEELAAAPDDGFRYELIGGEVFVSPAPTTKHQYVAGEMLAAMREFARRHRLGLVLTAPTDVRFTHYNVVEPDIVFVHRDRIERVTPTLIDGAPDVVVEVVSESSRQVDRIRKLTLYADHGVPEYWIVDPRAETLTVNVLADGRYLARPATGPEVPSDILRGLVVDPAELFTLPVWLRAERGEQG